MCVVLAASGYPGSVRTGDVITGLDEAEKLRDVDVVHAGTRLVDGKFVTSGGRVINVVATGATLREARDQAYAAAELICFDGKHYRTDIGARAL